jgi:uncharacterized membrane protein (UPF0127 family)
MRRATVLLAIAMLVGACSNQPSTMIVPFEDSTTTAAPVVPILLEGFDLDTIQLGDATLLVAVADTVGLRRRGLMNVNDLGDLDGMLFVFEEDSTVGFWMEDTPLPLDIAFFDAGGARVDRFTMEPCAADPCPVYRPAGPYRYALEMPAGEMPADPGPLSLPASQ